MDDDKKRAHRDRGWIEIGAHLKKMSGLVSILANFCGALFVTLYFTFFNKHELSDTVSLKHYIIPGVMFIFLVLLGTSIFRIWFRPLAQYIKLKSQGRSTGQPLLIKSRRKILNLPLLSAAASLMNWVLAALFMTGVVLFEIGLSNQTIETGLYLSKLFTGIIMGGVITCTMIFFLTENFCRKVLYHFFPDGGLTGTDKVFRLSLGVRVVITFLLASFIPMINLALLSYSHAKEVTAADPGALLSNLGILITFVLFANLSLALVLSYLFSRSIVKPVNEMQDAMAKVEHGDLTVSLNVSDNNELGMLAENFNQMIEGLRERYQIKKSLAVAREVQQSLLPDKDPKIQGLEIAGKILYSDETGGDYYDYIYPGDPAQKKIGVVVGDVSGHGISSALLMASTRAFIHQRLALAGDIADVVTDVNTQFSADVEASGRFMTLFFLSIDYAKNSFKWVRAGHEPAIVYDPEKGSFVELKGKGIALGIDGDFKYSENQKERFGSGTIILLCTDGIWEAKNNEGEMFGKQRIHRIIKANHDKTSAVILDSIVKSVEKFTESKTQEDDITLVIIKRTNTDM